MHNLHDIPNIPYIYIYIYSMKIKFFPKKFWLNLSFLRNNETHSHFDDDDFVTFSSKIFKQNEQILKH